MFWTALEPVFPCVASTLAPSAFLRATHGGAVESVKAKGDEQFGVEVVKAALEEPLRRIAENCGLDGGEVIAEVVDRKGNVGFDARTQEYKDLVKAGIIDPAKVTITALENAASAAAVNLTADVLITEVKKNTKPVAGAVL